MVDRLTADGLVERGPGPDGRTRAITLTEAGRAAAARVARARRDLLSRMLDGFTDDDLGLLEPLLGRLMRNAVLAKSGGAGSAGCATWRVRAGGPGAVRP